MPPKRNININVDTYPYVCMYVSRMEVTGKPPK